MVNEVDFRRFRQAYNVSVKKEFADDDMVIYLCVVIFVFIVSVYAILQVFFLYFHILHLVYFA